MQLGEEVKLLREVERDDFGLLMVDLHLVSDGEVCQVSQLVLEDGLISWEGKARSFMEVRRTNDLRGGH